MCADPNSLTKAELQLEKAWKLRKERAYMEIDLRVEDQQRVSRDNRDPQLAWITLRTVFGSRLANMKAALVADISQAQYDGSGILEFKLKMDELRIKLTNAGYLIPEQLYLNFFINALPEEYDPFVNTINYETDTVDQVINNLHQVEMKRGLHTSEGSVFATLKHKQPKAASTSQSSPVQRAKDTPKESSKPGIRRLGKCYNCGGYGHWSNKCSSPRKK